MLLTTDKFHTSSSNSFLSYKADAMTLVVCLVDAVLFTSSLQKKGECVSLREKYTFGESENKQTNKIVRLGASFFFFLGDRLRGEGLATDSVFSALTELLLNTKEMKRSKTNSH